MQALSELMTLGAHVEVPRSSNSAHSPLVLAKVLLYILARRLYSSVLSCQKKLLLTAFRPRYPSVHFRVVQQSAHLNLPASGLGDCPGSAVRDLNRLR